MLVAWDMSFHKVLVEVNSVVVLQLVKEDTVKLNAYMLIIHDILRLINQNWEIQLYHRYWEGNRVANFLATLILDMHDNEMKWQHPPVSVRPFVEADSVGVA
ncbi:Ribonuclease H [Quillaja saponaria]|uniref:Ribonuclease H n=1 Tax=Quillaja saponaria TaxID=32244 RepID=A0AAD7Q5I1_QUISA|nr:Ribonuclease H [Quillaja saponaria]